MERGKELSRTEKGGEQQGLTRGLWSPDIEVSERNGDVVVRADLPDLERKDLKVDVKNGALTISAERRSNREEKREGFYYSEQSYGSFARSITLPEGIDESSCDVRFENGKLEVTLKKRDEKH